MNPPELFVCTVLVPVFFGHFNLTRATVKDLAYVPEHRDNISDDNVEYVHQESLRMLTWHLRGI